MVTDFCTHFFRFISDTLFHNVGSLLCILIENTPTPLNKSDHKEPKSIIIHVHIYYSESTLYAINPRLDM